MRAAAITVAGTWGYASRRPLGRNGSLTFLHVCTSVALVGRNGTRALRARSRVRKGASTLQFSKDRVLVSEKITHKAVAVALVHGQSVLQPGTKDTGRQCISQSSNVGLIS